MDSMDLKGIAWVGNIYQKFEAMCLEVEEAMCQDLLPPSSKDLSRVAGADLLLNPYLEFGIHKKPISNIKGDNVNPVSIKGVSGNKSNSTDDIWEDWSASSFDWEISDNGEADCDQIVMQKSKKAKSSAKVGKRSRCIASSNITRAQHAGSAESSGPAPTGLSSCQLTNEGVSHTGSSECSGPTPSGLSSCRLTNEDVSHTESCKIATHLLPSHSDSCDKDNVQCGQSVGDEVLHSHTGSSADCDPDLKVETENYSSLQMVESIGHGSESGFEETCVLVDGNDYCLDHKEEIKRSYKKKIQNAFSLKKKSARKQEYKQLAAQYNTNKEEPIKITLSKNVKLKNLATHDSLESEWELL